MIIRLCQTQHITVTATKKSTLWNTTIAIRIIIIRKNAPDGVLSHYNVTWNKIDSLLKYWLGFVFHLMMVYIPVWVIINDSYIYTSWSKDLFQNNYTQNYKQEEMIFFRCHMLLTVIQKYRALKN